MQTIPWGKIESLQNEIKALKSLSKKKASKKTAGEAKPSSIEGILKGVEFTDEDFEEAKKIWFDYDHLMYQKHKQSFPFSSEKRKKDLSPASKK